MKGFRLAQPCCCAADIFCTSLVSGAGCLCANRGTCGQTALMQHACLGTAKSPAVLHCFRVPAWERSAAWLTEGHVNNKAADAAKPSCLTRSTSASSPAEQLPAPELERQRAYNSGVLAHLPLAHLSSLTLLLHLYHLSALSGHLVVKPCLLQGRASSDHTTLLLNCYTKLKNLSKLDFFLKGDGSDDGTPLLNFDVDTAVKVGPGLNKICM